MVAVLFCETIWCWIAPYSVFAVAFAAVTWNEILRPCYSLGGIGAALSCSMETNLARDGDLSRLTPRELTLNRPRNRYYACKLNQIWLYFRLIFELCDSYSSICGEIVLWLAVSVLAFDRNLLFRQGFKPTVSPKIFLHFDGLRILFHVALIYLTNSLFEALTHTMEIADPVSCLGLEEGPFLSSGWYVQKRDSREF